MERSATCLLRVKYSLIRAKKSASVSSVSLATEWNAKVKVTSNFFTASECFFCVKSLFALTCILPLSFLFFVFLIVVLRIHCLFSVAMSFVSLFFS